MSRPILFLREARCQLYDVVPTINNIKKGTKWSHGCPEKKDRKRYSELGYDTLPKTSILPQGSSAKVMGMESGPEKVGTTRIRVK